MSEQEYLHYRVVEAARTWLEDRSLKDPAEKQLAVALYDAFPDDFSSEKDRCDCGAKDDCDECLTRAELRDIIARWRGECSAPWVDSVDPRPTGNFDGSTNLAEWFMRRIRRRRALAEAGKEVGRG